MGKNLFNSIQLLKPKTNVFDLSHDVKLSCNMGQLVPTCVMECVPGDKFNLSCESLLRFAPMVAPVMHRFDVSIHYFFVPNRILWKNWENFITNTKVAGTVPAFPYVNVDDVSYTKLLDYLGIPDPDGSANVEKVSALPLAAYQMIWKEYYRDQNLQLNGIPDPLVDGNNTAAADLTVLRNRCWEHDYLTSALPFAQKGDAVNLPLGKIVYDNADFDVNNPPTFRQQDDVIGAAGSLDLTATTGTGDVSIHSNTSTSQASQLAYDPMGTLETESTTINDLRRAFRLQEWLERNARAGTRYVENILAHFGVRSSDKRLQRPEYITGVKSPVTISEVLNTTGTDDAPQGNMAGHGVAVTSGKYGKYFCEEHGYIMGVMSIMPKTAYQQGMPKHFMKHQDAFQYYWPSFANIGEQEVFKNEVMAFIEIPGTFGYTPRYAEYKFMPNRVAGDFRSTLNFWHAGRIFAPGYDPVLNEDFVESDPTLRIFAVTDPDVDHIWCHVYNKIRAVRPMPKFGTPKF